MKEELKPCPFCGGDAALATSKLVHCTNHLCKLSTFFTADEWNTRAPLEKDGEHEHPTPQTKGKIK